MKNIFLYYAKKRLLVIGIVLIMTLITSIVTTSTYKIFSLYFIQEQAHYRIIHVFLSYLTFIICCVATILPIYEFNFKMKKNSVDVLYSFPIKRTKLYLTKYIIGILEMFIIFTVNYLYILIFVSIVTKNPPIEFNISYYLPYYFIALGCGILIFSWFTFFFTLCNSTIDGIIVCFLTIFLGVIVVTSLQSFVNCYSNSDTTIYAAIVRYNKVINYTPYSVIIAFTNYFTRKIESKNYEFNTMYKYHYFIYIMNFISAITIPLFFIFNTKKKAEDTTDITKEWYIYNLLISLYIVFLFANVNISLIYLAVFGIGGYILYIIKNRTFKIRKIDLIFLLISIGVGLILTIMLNGEGIFKYHNNINYII